MSGDILLWIIIAGLVWHGWGFTTLLFLYLLGGLMGVGIVGSMIHRGHMTPETFRVYGVHSPTKFQILFWSFTFSWGITWGMLVGFLNACITVYREWRASK